MSVWKRLGAAVAGIALAGLLPSAEALANPKNALDAYVAKPDPAFAWKVVGPVSGPGYHGAVLELTSQTWLTEKQVDKPVWKHWLTVIVPDKLDHDKAGHDNAFLFITGGSNKDAAPTKATERWAKMAVEAHSVVTELLDVPNQPLRFTEDPRPRSED